MSSPGTVLAQRYRLDERVGGGAMGEVWRTTDTALDRTVAVKVVRPELMDEPGFRDRFLVEARTMAKIKHRGVVAVHDYHSDPELAFLVMEFVEGESLSHRLHRRGQLDPARAMSVIAQAADALQAAHDKGVIHRDVKPGNLLVTVEDVVVLTDFGIARSTAAAPLTATGAVVGTVAYLAPEQVLGKPATHRSDLYALGVVAYECLSGRRPFDGDNPFELAMKRVRDSPPALAGDIPAPVLGVVERALAADPDERWPTAAELARAARRAAAAGSAGRARVPGPRTGEAGGAARVDSAPQSASGPPAPPGSPGAGPGVPSPPPSPVPPPPLPHPAPSTPQPTGPGSQVGAAGAGPGVGPARPMPASYGYPGGGPVVGPPPSGYAAGGYPPHYPRPPGQQNTLGLLGMIFGILGLALFCCWFLALPLSAAGLVLGALGLRKASEGQASNRGMALAGVICGAIGSALGLLFLLLSVLGEFSAV